MSMREADRLKTIQAVVDRMARVGQAAQRLGLSRQLERLVQRYKNEGVAGLVSRKRGQPSNRQLAPGVAERATALIRDRYADFGPTLACEKLRECHGLALAKETVRALMTAAGLWTPRKQRGQDPPASQRRACVGELIQIDGSTTPGSRSVMCTARCWFSSTTPRAG
ncbi:transposase [Variovorax paradoxus]|uniref:helix-turn-helix domain-containing protein n=1 Tax=Variovorax paradoxus TaxID=34073 RepID=UPI002783C132|nr:transposase [Variovorax paradoxus]